jgi:transposase-like protein
MSNRKRGEKRRRYSDELKGEAVQMLLDGHSAESVASRLGRMALLIGTLRFTATAVAALSC